MTEHIGFIGLGIMGLPMATNLVKKSGRPVMGFDVAAARLAEFSNRGGKVAATTGDIWKSCDTVFLSLPTNDLVRRTLEEGMRAARKGTVIVDTSSSSPALIRELFPQVQAQGMYLLDAPVSGGEAGAMDASLVIMCGGDRAVYDNIEPLLACMGAQSTWMGGAGCGCVAKVANNMIVGCNIAAAAEAFAFAVKAGLDPGILLGAIKDGFAGSKALSVKIPKIISRDFSPSARLAIHIKDLENARHLAEDLGVRIPMAEQVLEDMRMLAAQGLADEDHCAVVKASEQRMGIEVVATGH